MINCWRAAVGRRWPATGLPPVFYGRPVAGIPPASCQVVRPYSTAIDTLSKRDQQLAHDLRERFVVKQATMEDFGHMMDMAKVFSETESASIALGVSWEEEMRPFYERHIEHTLALPRDQSTAFLVYDRNDLTQPVGMRYDDIVYRDAEKSKHNVPRVAIPTHMTWKLAQIEYVLLSLESRMFHIYPTLSAYRIAEAIVLHPGLRHKDGLGHVMAFYGCQPEVSVAHGITRWAAIATAKRSLSFILRYGQIASYGSNFYDHHGRQVGFPLGKLTLATIDLTATRKPPDLRSFWEEYDRQ